MERPPADAFDEVDGVINLVGEPIDQRWTEDAKRQIMESRRTGTRNLVQAITSLERRPKVLVSQSAIGFYGDRGESLVDESTAAGADFGAEVVHRVGEGRRRGQRQRRPAGDRPDRARPRSRAAAC